MPDQRPVAIANTSPLQYLHQCGLSDLFAKLYREVLVPPAVVQELAAGRTLGFDLPDPTGFPRVRGVRPQSMAILPIVSDLGAGEREALALAAETPGEILARVPHDVTANAVATSTLMKQADDRHPVERPGLGSRRR